VPGLRGPQIQNLTIRQFDSLEGDFPMKKSRKTPARKRLTKRARSTAHHRQPATLAAALASETGLIVALPRLGEYWPEQGGVLHGIMLDQDTKSEYALVSAVEHQHDSGTFAELQDYAKSLKIHGFSDFRMPDRRELRMQWINAKPGQFKAEWYWSGEQAARVSAYAWSQDFSLGDQLNWPKYSRCRGCAVRRVPIR
jgi:hypothetical protein